MNWLSGENEISRNSKNVKLMTYDAARGVPALDSEKQHHCYFYTGRNLLRAMGIERWEARWRQMYHELFKPSDYLQELLRSVRLPQNYVCVHIRFVNALGHFENGYDNYLPEAKQEQLVQACLSAIESVKKREEAELYVFSDSRRFLNIAEEKSLNVLDAAHIGHITFEKSKSVHDKTFIDFYAMAGSRKVYSVQGMGLYNSVFSQYAAIVGGAEYEAVSLENTM